MMILDLIEGLASWFTWAQVDSAFASLIVFALTPALIKCISAVLKLRRGRKRT